MKTKVTFLWMVVLALLLGLVGCKETVTPKSTPEPGATKAASPLATPMAVADSPLPTPAVWDVGEGRIVFRSDRDGSSHWYAMQPDGGDVRPMAFPESIHIVELKWVPALRMFSAVLRDNGQDDIYLVDGLGNVLRAVTTSPSPKDSVVYSAAADAFAFVCVGVDLDICTVPASGGPIFTVASSFAREAAPQWSPDGQRILFISNQSGIPDVWIIDADGENMQNLSRTGQPHSDPSWSPDGEFILFTSQRDFNWEVYVMDADGKNPMNLSQNPARDIGPKWSPDGAYIAFRSNREGENDDIYVLPAPGKGDLADVVNVTNTPSAGESVFGWSPDGSKIIYVSDVSGNLDIYTVNRDGSDAKNITDHPAADTGIQWIQ